MSRGSRWVTWFSDEDKSEAGAEYAKGLELAHECLKVAELPWFRRFLERLAEESMKPGTIGGHIDMIAAVSKANAYKELRAELLDEIARARSFVDSAREA